MLFAIIDDCCGGKGMLHSSIDACEKSFLKTRVKYATWKQDRFKTSCQDLVE